MSEYITPSRVKDLFRKISPEDCRFMGFDYPEIKPEYFILSEIPVGLLSRSDVGSSHRCASLRDASRTNDEERG